MVRVFDSSGRVIANINTDPDSKTATVRGAICKECDYLNVQDECWHPSQKCATRTQSWKFSTCPAGAWPKA